MRRVTHMFSLLAVCLPLLVSAHSLKENFVLGDPEIQSINALAFGPDHTLFIGDSDQAAIIAIDLAAQASMSDAKEIQLERVDALLADLLGTTPDQVMVNDMAVDPASQQVYLAVQVADGTPLLMRLEGETFVPVSLESVPYTKASLNEPVAADATDRRGRSLRKWAVSDMRYHDGKVLVSGLSNREFGSTFYAIDYPFEENQQAATLEIYHAAHGQYETDAPIKTFLPTTVNGEPALIAGYTCTPLVVFPMAELATGKHTKGRTVAELGNWNTPLDIIEMEKEGDRYILLANTARALMKIKMSDIESFGNSLTERIAERGGTAGVDFIALPFVYVLQLDRLNDQQFLMLQRQADGSLRLRTQGARWL